MSEARGDIDFGQDDMETFEIWVDGEFATTIQIHPMAEATIAALKSNPRIVWTRQE